MVLMGEIRHFEGSDTDEEEDFDLSEDDDESEEGGETGDEEEEGDDDEEESGEDDDSDGDISDGEDDEFPFNPSNNIVVEEYGVEDVPKDEDMDGGGTTKSEESASKRKLVMILCGCLVVVVTIAVVLAVVVFGGDDDTPARPKTASVPPVVMSASPSLQPTSLTPARTGQIPSLISIDAGSDSYVVFGGEGDEAGPFGDESTLLVQNDVDQNAAASFMKFNITELPEAADIEGWDTTATLTLTLVEPLDETITLVYERFPGGAEDVEEFTSGGFGDAPETTGPSFDVEAGETEVKVDVSRLIFDQGPVILRRRLTTQETQAFFGLMVSGSNETQSVRFYSSESDFPPRLDIELTQLTSAPSASAKPTGMPSISPRPSISARPSLRASNIPSDSPFVENDVCSICGTGNSVIQSNISAAVSPLLGDLTCGALQNLGDSGFITPENCTLLQELLPLVDGSCCFESMEAFDPPSNETFFCDMCLDGGNITNPEAIVTIPGIADNTCAAYQMQAENVAIPETLCSTLQLATDAICCDFEL